jgi:hypothetical protein
LPAPGEPHEYAQIYVLDPEAASQRRLNLFDGLDQEAVDAIEATLRAHNPYAQQFYHLSRTIAQPGVNGRIEEQAVALRLLDNRDTRLYNTPTANEVAVVVPDGNFVRGRDVIVHARGKGLQRIAETSPYYDPLRYPLLFPHGEFGWHLGLLHNSTTTPTVCYGIFLFLNRLIIEYYCRETQQLHGNALQRERLQPTDCSSAQVIRLICCGRVDCCTNMRSISSAKWSNKT